MDGDLVRSSSQGRRLRFGAGISSGIVRRDRTYSVRDDEAGELAHASLDPIEAFDEQLIRAADRVDDRSLVRRLGIEVSKNDDSRGFRAGHAQNGTSLFRGHYNGKRGTANGPG